MQNMQKLQADSAYVFRAPGHGQGAAQVGGIKGRDGAIEHGLTVINNGGTPWRHATSTTVDLLGHEINCDVGIPPGIKSKLKGNLKQKLDPAKS